MDQSASSGNQRRKELTDEWKERGVRESREYALLTDELTQAWSGMTTREYKLYKGLRKESLRDNMSTLELALNMLAEAATTEISKEQRPEGLSANIAVAHAGGNAAKAAKESVEQSTGRPVITSKNAMQLNHMVSQKIKDSAALSLLESSSTELSDDKV